MRRLRQKKNTRGRSSCSFLACLGMRRADESKTRGVVLIMESSERRTKLWKFFNGVEQMTRVNQSDFADGVEAPNIIFVGICRWDRAHSSMGRSGRTRTFRSCPPETYFVIQEPETYIVFCRPSQADTAQRVDGRHMKSPTYDGQQSSATWPARVRLL